MQIDFMRIHIQAGYTHDLGASRILLRLPYLTALVHVLGSAFFFSFSSLIASLIQLLYLVCAVLLLYQTHILDTFANIEHRIEYIGISMAIQTLIHTHTHAQVACANAILCSLIHFDIVCLSVCHLSVCLEFTRTHQRTLNTISCTNGHCWRPPFECE